MALRLCVSLQQIEYLRSYCEIYLNKQVQILQTASLNDGEVIWGSACRQTGLLAFDFLFSLVDGCICKLSMRNQQEPDFFAPWSW